MKRVLFFLTAVFLLAAFAGGCGGEKKAEKPAAKPAAAETKKAEAASATSAGGRKILVAYFSRTGEEYGVGVITKGNTAVVADAIAEITGADKFEIKTVKPYPHAYRETTDIAKKELQDNVRPEIVGKPENLKNGFKLIGFRRAKSYNIDSYVFRKQIVPFTMLTAICHPVFSLYYNAAFCRCRYCYKYIVSIIRTSLLK